MQQIKDYVLFNKLITISKLSWIDRLWFYSKLDKEKRIKVLSQIKQLKKMNEPNVDVLVREELTYSVYTKPIRSIIETLNTEESYLTKEVELTIKGYLSQAEGVSSGN